MAEPALRRVRLFRDEQEQTVHIPAEFEWRGTEAILRRDGDRLILEPVCEGGLLALLASWGPLDDTFPDIDEGLLPLRDVVL